MNESIASQPVVDPQLRAGLSEARRTLDKAARRMLDLTVAALGILCLAPFFVLIAVLLKRGSKVMSFAPSVFASMMRCACGLK